MTNQNNQPINNLHKGGITITTTHQDQLGNTMQRIIEDRENRTYTAVEIQGKKDAELQQAILDLATEYVSRGKKVRVLSHLPLDQKIAFQTRNKLATNHVNIDIVTTNQPCDVKMVTGITESPMAQYLNSYKPIIDVLILDYPDSIDSILAPLTPVEVANKLKADLIITKRI